MAMYASYKYQSQPNQPRPIVLYIPLLNTLPNAAVTHIQFVMEPGPTTLQFQFTNQQVLSYNGIDYLRVEPYGPASSTPTTPLVGHFEITYTKDTTASAQQPEVDTLDCILYPD